jgi:2-oxoglutarate dehydrogenase E2 component (dihydrolipoamide succinyltransferase)
VITTILVPQINTNDDEVEIIAWHVHSGAYVETGQDLAELETSKATVTLSSECAGYVRCLLPSKATARVGAPLCHIATTTEELTTAPMRAPNPPPVVTPPKTNGVTPPGRYGSTRFSQRASELLKAHALPEEAFGNAGLVTAAQVNQLLGLAGRAPPTVADERREHGSNQPADPPRASLRSERVARAKQAEIAALSVGAGAHINSTLSVRFDSAAIRARLLRERMFEGTVQPLVIYEISRLLPQWPQLNAFYADDAVHFYPRVDLGLAMDLGKGLKVVTIPQADQRSPVQIFEHTLGCARRYLENGLQAEELSGSTVTVTDLSGFDILEFRPLINGRQSAIIGVGGDQTLPGHPMTISVTFDHRVASGREVALFLGELRARLLSYAEPTGCAADVVSMHEGSALVGANFSGACERCGVSGRSYYESFARDGYLLAFYRPDGSLGCVCHRCFGSWN